MGWLARCMQLETDPKYTLNRRLATLQSQSGHFGEKKSLLFVPGFEPQILEFKLSHCSDWAVGFTQYLFSASMVRETLWQLNVQFSNVVRQMTTEKSGLDEVIFLYENMLGCKFVSAVSLMDMWNMIICSKFNQSIMLGFKFQQLPMTQEL